MYVYVGVYVYRWGVFWSCGAVMSVDTVVYLKWLQPLCMLCMYVCILVLMSSIEPLLLIPCPPLCPTPRPNLLPLHLFPSSPGPPPPQLSGKGRMPPWMSVPSPPTMKRKWTWGDDWGPTGMHWVVGCCIAYAPVHSAVTWTLCTLQSLHIRTYIHTVHKTCCVHS